MSYNSHLKKLARAAFLDIIMTGIIGLTLIGGTLLISYKVHPPLPIAYLILSIITILTTLTTYKKHKKHIQKLKDYEKLVKSEKRKQT